MSVCIEDLNFPPRDDLSEIIVNFPKGSSAFRRFISLCTELEFNSAFSWHLPRCPSRMLAKEPRWLRTFFLQKLSFPTHAWNPRGWSGRR